VTGRRRFEGRSCLVTGSTGIAAAAARALAVEGASVFVVSRTADHARQLADDLQADGGRAGWLSADLSREDEAEASVAACVEQFARLDCVYNVAGISGRRFGDGPLHELTVEGWQTVMATNAASTFLVCRAAVRQMLGQAADEAGARGAILNMSSVLARSPSPEHFATHAYAASKGAIEAFSLTIAAYYAPEGIRVNVIAPALVATTMSGRAQADRQIGAYLATKQPLAGGPLQPDDLVGTALYLLSDDERMVIGQVVAIDGGWEVSQGGSVRRVRRMPPPTAGGRPGE
jgi:NAD(P)-dependent dehydrogenase (short-subunit alcohol dehydrogenase family)